MTNGPYWITKYALSSGIKKVGSAKVSKVDPGYIYVFPISSGYRLGRDAFDNEADAISDAVARRVKKVASLKKQITKLEKLDFAARAEQAL